MSTHDVLSTLSGRIGQVVASHAEGCKIESRLWLSCTDLYYARDAQGLLLMRVRDAPSQLELPSLTPLSVAGCGRLKLGVPNSATSVITASGLYLTPPHSVVVDSPLAGSRLLAKEDFYLF